MTLKGQFGKNDDIGGATGMMAAAGSQADGSQAESGVAGAVLGAGFGESSPGGVGGEGPVFGAGESVGVRHGGGGDGGDRAGGGVRRRGGTYRSSSAPTPLRSSTSHRLLTAFLVRFAGGGDGAGGDIGGECSGAGGEGGGGSGRVDGGAARLGG
jgi:hypothetical protein